MKEDLKTTKKRGIVRFGLQVLLLFAVVFTLYYQLKDIQWESFAQVRIANYGYLALAILLLLPNQGIEYWKWLLFTRHFVEDRTVIRKSFLAGLASGFLSPNGWGNVFGRMFFFGKRNALQIVLVTALGNLSQLIPTAVFGSVALLFREKLNPAWCITSGVIALVLLVTYFLGEHFLRTKTRHKVLRHFKLMLERFGYLRGQLLLLSTIRFLVFTLQFVLLFAAFGYHDWWLLTYSIWIIYLLTSFVPSLWSGKLLIRETAALFVFQNTVVDAKIDIVVICLLIWIINIVIPSLIGSFALVPIKRSAQWGS